MFDKNKYIKEKIKNYYGAKRQQNKQKQIYEQLSRDDIIYKIINNLRHRMSDKLKLHNVSREVPYSKILGCDPKVFKRYIEAKFTEDMSFENYGKWEIDHIFPISKVDFNNFDEIDKCFHYTNLQPLWSKENKEKKDKIVAGDY